MTTTDAALAHLRDAATTGRWDAAAAETLMSHLSPDPAEVLTRDHLDLRLGAELSAVRADLRTEMADLRTDLTTQMAHLRTELRTEMADLRTDLSTQMADLRTELRTDMADLRIELHRDLVTQTRWIVGTLVASVLGFGSLLAGTAVVLG